MDAERLLSEEQSYREMSFAVPWGVIAAKEWGRDDGKPFLGLHGFLDNANTFDRQVVARFLLSLIMFSSSLKNGNPSLVQSHSRTFYEHNE